MKDPTERETPNSQGSEPVDRFGKVLPSRRRLLTGGLAAAPLLASIESRNALAAVALTPSGNLSGNVSTRAQAGVGTGSSPAFWDGAADVVWPGGLTTMNTPFHPLFASGAVANFGQDNLKKVVGYPSTSSPSEAQVLGAYFVAAYLNISNGLVSIPGFDQPGLINLLKGIWADYAANGAYKVNTTVSWNASQIKFYLISNGFAA